MITIISGTNRPDSRSRILAEIYASLLRERQIEHAILDLAELPIDFTATALYDNSGKNEAFNQLANFVSSSEKFVFIVSEYNGSFPGVLKAFIDGLAYPNSFRNKKGALAGISSGTQGGLLAMSHLTDVLNYLGMHVLAGKVRIPQIEKQLGPDQNLSPFYLDLINQQIDQFLSF
jgi:chromate reductase, NAD(P)H dehydrogenase (quinone)